MASHITSNLGLPQQLSTHTTYELPKGDLHLRSQPATSALTLRARDQLVQTLHHSPFPFYASNAYRPHDLSCFPSSADVSSSEVEASWRPKLGTPRCKPLCITHSSAFKFRQGESRPSSLLTFFGLPSGTFISYLSASKSSGYTFVMSPSSRRRT